MRRKSGDQMEDNTTLIAMETTDNYGSINMDAPVQAPDRNVFSDGKTRIDFVLVWEEPNTDTQQEQEVEAKEFQNKTETKETKEGKSEKHAVHKNWREKFLAKLKNSGLLLEESNVVQSKTRTCYVLLNAPWDVLCYYAEEIRLRAPLQVVNSPVVNWSEQVFSHLSLKSPFSQTIPNPPNDYYTCQFRTNKMERFLGSDNKETFFKTTQRHQVLYEILARTPYGTIKKGEVGIDRLLSEQVFSAAYPLHEGDFQPPSPPVPPQSLSIRQILYSYWAKWSCWTKYQPLDHIRDYFGEKIALYFAWLGFYTAWLLPASILGTVIFIFGFWLMATDVPAKEVCESGDTFLMCPLCNICSHWNYSSICMAYKAGLLFDNGGTVFLSVFMSLWAVTFLEYWKRKCSTLSHRWDCAEFEDIEERPRPEFTAMAPLTIRNPVTGAEEPYFPESKRLNRTLTGCIIIISMVLVVLMFLIGIILYRGILRAIIYKSGHKFASFSAGPLASLSGSVLNLLVILMLSRVNTSLAHMLTRWEMHRTQTKYEDMFILKCFIFQFVNFYSSPVYIAFFKGRFVGYPGKYRTLFGIRNEDCGAGGCLIELAQELLVIMVGKQLINNIQEFIGPKLKCWWQKRKTQKIEGEKKEKNEGKEEKNEDKMAAHKKQEVNKTSPWESDYQLLECEGLFSEYLEMVLQFGFITIFVAACPLAPLFALMNNWIEVRLDAQKFVTEYRRPVSERVQDIGIWFPILQFIAHIAVLSNAFLIAFTSSFVPRMYYLYTKDGSMSGFTNFTLSVSPQNYKHTPCRYRGFRDEEGKHLPEYFHLLAIRLTFVIVFEHVVFFVGRLIDMMVPDVPEEVEMKMKREHYMAKQALAENQSLGQATFFPDAEDMSGDLRHRKPKPKTKTNPSTPSDSPPPNVKDMQEEEEHEHDKDS